MTAMTHQAISLDLDDTVWPGDDVIEHAERVFFDWLAHHAPRLTASFDLEAMRAERAQAAEQSPHLAADLTALRREVTARQACRTGYDPALADAAVEVFLAARHRVQPYSDVLPALESLGQRYRLIALTNGNADVNRTRLGAYFDVAVGAADVGVGKPDPAMFRLACRRVGIRPGDLVHVGDDPVRDIHAARRFGARSVWLDRFDRPWPEGVARAHHDVGSLAEVVDLVARLEAG
jgi:putative hydrolase of the HAD superfamily